MHPHQRRWGGVSIWRNEVSRVYWCWQSYFKPPAFALLSISGVCPLASVSFIIKYNAVCYLFWYTLNQKFSDLNHEEWIIKVNVRDKVKCYNLMTYLKIFLHFFTNLHYNTQYNKHQQNWSGFRTWST